MKRNAVIFAACISLTEISQAMQQVPSTQITLQPDNFPTLELSQQAATTKNTHFSASHAINMNNEQALTSHRLLKYFAVEARIDSVGEYKLEDSFDSLQTEFATYTGNAIGILPFGDSGLELFGQVGAGWVANRMDSTFASPDDSSPVGTFGMGLRYSRSNSSPLSLIAGFDSYHFQANGKQLTSRSDHSISKTSLGLQYNF